WPTSHGSALRRSPRSPVDAPALRHLALSRIRRGQSRSGTTQSRSAQQRFDSRREAPPPRARALHPYPVSAARRRLLGPVPPPPACGAYSARARSERRPSWLVGRPPLARRRFLPDERTTQAHPAHAQGAEAPPPEFLRTCV